MSRSRLSRLLSERALVGLSVIVTDDDLRAAPRAVALAAGPDEALVVELDGAARAELSAWLSRTDRVVVLDVARPQLRKLLAAGVDVARPVCLASLRRLAGGRDDDEPRLPRDAETARGRAARALEGLADVVEALERDGLRKVARLECLVLRPFAALEHRGLPIDVAGWRALVEEARGRMRRARQEVFAALGDHVSRDLFGEPDLSLESEHEVRAVLERVLGYTLSDLSKQTLGAVDHPATGALLRYREAFKIVSTYGDAFLDHVDPRTGRIHATFLPLGASTGRVASREPNLQNLPGDERFHRCLAAPEGRALVTADYATCELRILAELSGDPRFSEAFERGEDLHSFVASRVFGVPVSKSENAHLRQQAKAINFGLVYGMGAGALAAQVGKSLDEAEALLERYFQTFPRIRRYLEDSVDRALSRGFSETVLGRKLVFDPEVVKGENARGELGRIAKNMPIQGTSADMTKLAMVRVHERLLEEHPGAGLVNTIHDELVVECDEGEAERVAEAVRVEMEEAHRTLLKKVPPLVEVHAGRHWMH